MKRFLRNTLMALAVMCLLAAGAHAQGLLQKHITIHAEQKPLATVLKDVSKLGGFTFSYNTGILRGDSLVSVSAQDRTVKQVLDALFGGRVEYKETDNYLILQRPGDGGYWFVSGYVTDRESGERITDASVYEPNQLVATLTNNQGYFRLRMKDKHPALSISVSKMSYRDTSLIIKPGIDNELVVSMSPQDYMLDSVVITQRTRLEHTWYGKLFMSSKDQMQSLNLNKFFVDKPFQVSITPGLGTHGKMSAQVENKFSFNILGGYTAAVNGFELGGLFNIVKKDARYAQVAGLFNVVGGSVSGAQVAGLFNQTLGSATGAQVGGLTNILSGGMRGAQISGLYNHVQGGVHGVQIGGLVNTVHDSVDGVQVAGLYNHVSGAMAYTQVAGLVNYVNETLDGTQIAGISNFARKEVKGAQIAGIGNVAPQGMKGIQIAGIYNYTSRLTGSQIGVINICDTSSGYSIGILNIVKKGYHKVSVSTNEMLQFNAALKTGNKKLYSIVAGGMNLDADRRAYSFGFGFGKEVVLGRYLSLNPELFTQQIYAGDWDHHNILNRVQLDLQFNPTSYLSVFAGPVYSVFYTQQRTTHEGYRLFKPETDFNAHKFGPNVWGWLGWNVGISIF